MQRQVAANSAALNAQLAAAAAARLPGKCHYLPSSKRRRIFLNGCELRSDPKPCFAGVQAGIARPGLATVNTAVANAAAANAILMQRMMQGGIQNPSRAETTDLSAIALCWC